MLFVQLVIVGLFAGALSGMLGVGGGIILIPALLFFAKLSIHQALAVSLAIIIPTALVGFLKHYSSSNIDLWIIFYVCIGSIVGSYFGAMFAQSLSGIALKKIFGFFLVCMGIYFLMMKSEKTVEKIILDDPSVAMIDSSNDE